MDFGKGQGVMKYLRKSNNDFKIVKKQKAGPHSSLGLAAGSQPKLV